MASSLLLWPRGNQGRSHLATWRGRAAWPQRLRGVDWRVLAGDGQREEAAKARGVVTHHGGCGESVSESSLPTAWPGWAREIAPGWAREIAPGWAREL